MLPKDTYLGELTMVEIYEFYDQPLLFLAQNTNSEYYLVVCCDESPQSSTWLFVQISESTLTALREGKLSYYLAFKKNEFNNVFIFTYDFRSYSTSGKRDVELSDKLLPDKDAFVGFISKPKDFS